VQLLKDIGDLREKLGSCSDPQEQRSIRKELEETKLRYNLIAELKKCQK
jgi:hypothetical protein